MLLLGYVHYFVSGYFSYPVGVNWTGSILLVGALTCLGIGLVGRGVGERNAATDTFFFWAMVVSLEMWSLSGVNANVTTRAEALAYAEGGFLSDLSGVYENYNLILLLDTIPHLSNDGGRVPDTQEFERAFETWAEKGLKSYAVGRVALNMPHLLTDSMLKQRPLPRSWNRLVAEDDTFFHSGDEVLRMLRLERKGPLTSEQKQSMTARALAVESEADAIGVLPGLYERWLILDHLQQPEAIGQLAPAVRRSLLATWMGPWNEGQAGFSCTVTIDGPGKPETRSTLGYLDDTDSAIRLMAEFGVPDGIELEKLHAYLLGYTAGRSNETGAWYASIAALRFRLESLPAWQALEPKYTGDRIRRPSSLITAIAFALLGILVTLRARRGDRLIASLDDAHAQ
ncbi:MAG: hypothetical protein JKY61_03365 [Planctomycetes bacterium]|nr:hypothetical protein [Planctomycetota bacterium]